MLETREFSKIYVKSQLKDDIWFDIVWPRGGMRTHEAVREGGIIVSGQCFSRACKGMKARRSRHEVLDIPIHGTEGLSESRPFRPLDRALQRCGIPLFYPSYRAGARGRELARETERVSSNFEVSASRPDRFLRRVTAAASSRHFDRSVTPCQTSRTPVIYRIYPIFPPGIILHFIRIYLRSGRVEGFGSGTTCRPP